MLGYLPKAALSRLAGRVARTPASRHLIPWFIRHYHAEMAGAIVPPGGYPTLQSFFTRRLHAGARPVWPAPGLVSPVDGTVGASGRIDQGQLLQAKGRRYRLLDLVGGEPDLAAGFEGGLYCTLYLAPGNYHRIHAPASAILTRVRHLPGRFFPVNPRAVASVPNLFAENERMVVALDLLDADMPAGPPAVVPSVLVLVGACLVGGIRLAAHPGDRLGRGAELGWFEFGSTVILLLPPSSGLAWVMGEGRKLRMGEPLARLASSPDPAY